MPKVITITLKTHDEVLAELQERLPQVYSSVNIQVTGEECPWVWLYGTEKDEQQNKTLKDIGFKWSGKRQGWYHTCETDMTKRSWGRGRGRQTKGGKTNTVTPRQSAKPAKPAPYRPTTNVDDEFARRFG